MSTKLCVVDDDQIVDAQRALWNDLRSIVEPGGAAAYSLILRRRLPTVARRAGGRRRVRVERRPVNHRLTFSELSLQPRTSLQ